MTRVRIAQLGSRHGHAPGKWAALQASADVDAVGIWEPDASLRGRSDFPDARWCASEKELLADRSVIAVAVEGRNHESLAMAARAVQAGKHLWFDKPAGDDWPAFARLVDQARQRQLVIQMGYMFRYSPGFIQVAQWARTGTLGQVFAIRAHMSTNVGLAERTEQSRHRGGILYDLGGHMIDQIVWLLGRPEQVSSVQRNDATPELPAYRDNALAILEFEHAVATIDIAAMEPRPVARRLEVYGTRASAILEPFDPPRTLRLAVDGEAEQVVTLAAVTRQTLYDRELAAFVRVLRGEAPADRSLAHEQLVQETLLRVCGDL